MTRPMAKEFVSSNPKVMAKALEHCRMQLNNGPSRILIADVAA